MKIFHWKNLNKFNIPTVLETTSIKGINEEKINEVFEFGLNNDFIFGIIFRPCSDQGGNKIKSDHFTVENIVQVLDNKQKISLKNINRFQKLSYFL